MSAYIDSNNEVKKSDQLFIDDKSDLNLDRIEELRLTLPQELNKFYSDRDCHRFLVKYHFDLPKCTELITKHYSWYLTPVTTWKIENPGLSPRDMGKTEVDSKQTQFNEVFPCSYLGEDREGHPIFWEKTGYTAANWGNVKKHFNPDEIMARHIRQQELMMERCRNATQRNGRIIEKQLIIKDMKGVPFFADWGSLTALKDATHIDETYYPGNLKILFMINANGYFTALWSIVKPWLDPSTIQKIQILGEDYYETLSKHISEDMIPVEYGGKRADFSWVHPTNFRE